MIKPRFAVLTAAFFAAQIVFAMIGDSRAAGSDGHVVVEDPVIRLGDLFADAGSKSGVPIGAAPAPGARAVFDTDRLVAIARAYGVRWQPSSRYHTILVERAGRTIEGDEVTALLRAALAPHGLPADARIDIANRRLKLVAALDASQPPRAETVSYDPGDGRFEVLVAVPQGPGAVHRVMVAGRAVEMMRIAVPARDIRKDEVITPVDVIAAEFPADELGLDMLRAPDELIGQSVRRGLRAGQPVRSRDVEAPVLVAKGSLVTMTLRTRHMVLTASGKALENGALGQTVRVTNSRSHSTVEGQVTGAGQVVVHGTSLPLRVADRRVPRR